jgi:hypothetical protein
MVESRLATGNLQGVKISGDGVAGFSVALLVPDLVVSWASPHKIVVKYPHSSKVL